MRSILVPLDGSSFSEQAVPTAAAIARRAGAELRLVRVHVPAALLPFAGSTPVEAEYEHRVRQGEAGGLDRLARAVAAEYDVPVARALLDGPVVETIERYVQDIGADMIAMTTHGRGGISRAWLGSVADGLIRKIDRPVLLIRPERHPPELLVEAVFRRVLVPLDGSGLAERVIPHALAVAGPTGAEFLLLQVVPPILPNESWAAGFAIYLNHANMEQRAAGAEAYLDRLAAQLERSGVRVATRVMVHAHPAVAILEEAENQAVDLVAMATHGRGGVVRLVLGSVADKVLRGAHAPLLLIRPEAAR